MKKQNILTDLEPVNYSGRSCHGRYFERNPGIQSLSLCARFRIDFESYHIIYSSFITEESTLLFALEVSLDRLSRIIYIVLNSTFICNSRNNFSSSIPERVQ